MKKEELKNKILELSFNVTLEEGTKMVVVELDELMELVDKSFSYTIVGIDEGLKCDYCDKHFIEEHEKGKFACKSCRESW